MIFNLLKIKIIQVLLIIDKNIKYIYLIISSILVFLTFSIFGFWKMFSGYLHLVILLLIITFTFFLFFIYRKKFKYISYKNAVLWIEKKNFKTINPISAAKDIPVGKNINISTWNAHINQTKENLKKINFYLPKLSLKKTDPLMLRLVFILFFVLSLIWGNYNNSIKDNLLSIFEIKFKEKNNLDGKFNILAWIKPPNYTGLNQKNIPIENFFAATEKEINVPFASEIFIKSYGHNKKNIAILLNDKVAYVNKKNNNLDINFKLYDSKKFKIEIDSNKYFMTYLNVMKDTIPDVKFISDPALVNGVSLKFLVESTDDYGIATAKVLFSKPTEFTHFEEEQLIYNLELIKTNNKTVKSLFFKNMSKHIWAGSQSRLTVAVSDDINQTGTVSKNIIIPEIEFKSPIAKQIYLTRSDLAKKNISIKDAKKIIENLQKKNEKLNNYNLIREKYQKVSNILSKLKNIPVSYESPLYATLWELASIIEEGKSFSVKKNLEQIEQNLFDSINQRETDKISTNVEEFKESVQSLLDMNNEEGNNSLNHNDKNRNIKDQLSKATKDLEDLLKTGTKENLTEKIQELEQLSDSIKNPKKLNENEIFKEQQKRDFINKLSELLNDQEIIMEESFNEAANRGKFKQSSEGSGGRTSKEKQENLRNTLGNIMRDIGESENEIPQELGRADRAMRQATRELENGRPDQASNAQGRATEMIRRAMNRIRYDNDKLAENSSSKPDNDLNMKSELNTSDKNNNMEYQGTSLGGTIEIPYNVELQEAQKIAKELYNRYNQKNRSIKEKEYIKNLLDWY